MRGVARKREDHEGVVDLLRTPPRANDRAIGWRPGAPITAVQALALQRGVGNRAVTGLLDVVDTIGGTNLTQSYRSVRGQVVYSTAGILLDASDHLGKGGGTDNFDAQLALASAASDLMTMETYLRAEDAEIDAAAAQREAERLRAELTVLNLQLDHQRGHPGFRAHERLLILGFLAAGIFDRNRIIDAVFYSRHPKRSGQLLDPGTPADAVYIREWKSIAGSLVPSVAASDLGKLLTASSRAKKRKTAAKK